jgi:methylated-DNA-protein-cysteine methyltransferase-like protein
MSASSLTRPAILRFPARRCKARGVSRWKQIYRVVSRIPRGRVATYGQVALLAGLPHGAREVGWALAALLDDPMAVPWQRVVNARGEVSPRRSNPGDLVQRRLLRAEGIRFDRRGRIDLERYLWHPRTRKRPRRSPRPRQG